MVPKKKGARLLSLLLTLALLLSLLPSTAVHADGGVAINETNFPDANFRSYVAQYDTSGDNALSDAELAAVTKITCGNRSIASRALHGAGDAEMRT